MNFVNSLTYLSVKSATNRMLKVQRQREICMKIIMSTLQQSNLVFYDFSLDYNRKIKLRKTEESNYHILQRTAGNIFCIEESDKLMLENRFAKMCLTVFKNYFYRSFLQSLPISVLPKVTYVGKELDLSIELQFLSSRNQIKNFFVWVHKLFLKIRKIVSSLLPFCSVSVEL